MDIILPICIAATIIFIVIGLLFFVAVPHIEEKPFILANICNPVAPITISTAIIIASIGLAMVYNFLIPVFIIFSAIGYLLLIKYLPKFVVSQSIQIQNAINRSNMFPYYGTILLTTFWPMILLFRGINSIFKIMDIKIETPKKSVQRALNSDKGQ